MTTLGLGVDATATDELAHVGSVVGVLVVACVVAILVVVHLLVLIALATDAPTTRVISSFFRVSPILARAHPTDAALGLASTGRLIDPH